MWRINDQKSSQKDKQEKGSFIQISHIPWPTIFRRPNITHFEEKNSRPDFQKIICVKVK